MIILKIIREEELLDCYKKLADDDDDDDTLVFDKITVHC